MGAPQTFKEFQASSSCVVGSKAYPSSLFLQLKKADVVAAA